MPGDLTAVVTGGAYEEGLSAAEALLRAGARVSIWDENEERLVQAKTELEAQNLTPEVRRVDVGDPKLINAAKIATESTLGPIDAVINMATLKNPFMIGEANWQSGTVVPVWDLDLDRMRRAVEVNILGTVFCTNVMAADMVARGSGSIVNFSCSLQTQRSANIPYGPSKAFVEAFSASAARQTQPYGVRVNVICSNGQVNRRGKNDPKRQPSDWLARLVVYLASDESEKITGQIFEGASLTPSRT